MPTLTYLEKVSNTSPNSAGFSTEGGRAVGIYFLEDATTEDLQATIIDILGNTGVDPTDGRMTRVQPVAHPIYPWLVANSITDIRGIGPTGDNSDAATELEAPTITTEYADYNDWQISVEFKTRPYPVSADHEIVLTSGSWIDTSGSPQTFMFPYEWDRYTTFEYIPKDDNNISCRKGNLIFSTSSGDPNGLDFSASPQMYLPDMYLRVTWYGVPYRYITSTNSYITQYRGKINQNDVQLAGAFFPAGSLQYLHFSPKVYTPPVNKESLFAPGVFSTNKLCNIELTFLYTTRTPTNAPTPPTNGNYIVAGHNLLPWLTDRKFYFALTKPTSGPGVPAWESFPLELLQADPDA